MSKADLKLNNNSTILNIVKMMLVVCLWFMPTWLVWRVLTQPTLQRGLSEWQIGVLTWYPLIAILMLFFAVVLFRRLPSTWLGLCAFLFWTLVLPGLHFWLSKTTSLTILIAEWATFSMTIFVIGFSTELFRRIVVMAKKGYWKLSIFGGLANIILFVVPGVLIALSLYKVLYLQGLFQGGFVIQAPLLVALAMAARYEWLSFKNI